MYLPYRKRTPDTQYQEALRFIMKCGDILETPQDVPARTCFGVSPPLVYFLHNGAPIITERQMGWRAPIGEMCAFINGVQDFAVMKSEFGVPAPFWEPWVTEQKCAKVGAETGHLGDASYGPALAAFPMSDGRTFDQFAHVVNMLSDAKLRKRRTIYATAWIPFMNGWGGNQRAVVSPCHGFIHFRAIGNKLDLVSWHRSADMPLGFPNDMIAYTALLLAVGHLTKLAPRRIIFQLSDAHIYENQVEAVRTLAYSEPRRLPTLTLVHDIQNLRELRREHFELTDYHPHARMNIPTSV